MPLLNTMDKYYVGGQLVDAVYIGDEKIWPVETGGFSPDDLSGLTVWHIAEDYTPGSWPNRGSGPDPAFAGTPVPPISVNTLNELPLVRFKANEGTLRGTGMLPSGTQSDLTVIYLTRMVGPTVGRIFGNPYPPINFLLGAHISGEPQMYDNGWVGNNYAFGPLPTPWRMYGTVCTWTPRMSSFYVDGIFKASHALSNGHASEYNLSGYGVTEETCDFEVAELICYDRALSDSERIAVEEYLYNKWFVPRWDPDTQAYLTATGLNVSYAPILDDLVVGLKDAGLWDKMRAIYPFIGGTEALHKWNLKDPRDLDAAYRLTFTGSTSSHSTDFGYRPNAQGGQGAVANGGYADTHFIPLGNLGVNSTHLAYYSLADLTPISRCEMGCYNWAGSGSRFHIIARYTPDGYYYGQNENGASYGTVPASTGLFVATRTAVDLQAGYRNGALVASNTNGPASGLPPVPVWVGGINTFVDRSDLPCGFASIGEGLTTQDNIDLNLIVNDYQTALGRRPVFTGFW